MRIIRVGKSDDLFCGKPFQKLHVRDQAGGMQVQVHVLQIHFGFGFVDLPIERIHRAPPARIARRVHHMQQSDLRFKCMGQGNRVRQHALGEWRAIQGEKNLIKHQLASMRESTSLD